MAVVAFPARNKLAYPAGIKPGFDPSHPAASNCYFSAVPGGGPNFIDLTTGSRLVNLQGTQTTAPTAGVDGLAGPAINGGTGSLALGKNFSKTINNTTIGLIFKYSVSSATYQSLMQLDSANLGLYVHTGAYLDFFAPSAVAATSVVLTVGHSYFIAMSGKLAGAGSPFFFLAKNLTTGQILTQALTNTDPAVTIANIGIGNDNQNLFPGFPIAAGMFADVYLSPQQLLQWANDPWAFWYGNAAKNRAAAAAAASFLAAWARQSNLPVLGTGTY